MTETSSPPPPRLVDDADSNANLATFQAARDRLPYDEWAYFNNLLLGALCNYVEPDAMRVAVKGVERTLETTAVGS